MSRRGRIGRPPVAKAIQDLIRTMSEANPTWGSPRIDHYHRWRCHQSLTMDCPEPRPVQPPEQGDVVEVAESGGMYRHYERRAA